MGHSEALNGGFATILTCAALISSFIFPAEIPVILIVLAFPCVIYAIAEMIGNDYGGYSRALAFFWKFVLVNIFLFAIIYWRYGLLVNDVQEDVNIFEAFYFSLNTLTTLSYGDYVPGTRIKHVASIEALVGYFALAMWIYLLSGFINNKADSRMKIRIHNRKIIEEHEKKKAADNKNLPLE